MTSRGSREQYGDVIYKQRMVEQRERVLKSGPLERGTPAWLRREFERMSLGCRALSFGSIPMGKASMIRKARRVK